MILCQIPGEPVDFNPFYFHKGFFYKYLQLKQQSVMFATPDSQEMHEPTCL